MKIRELINKIEKDFPSCSAMSFDNSGANIVEYDDELKGILITLDTTIAAIEYAKKNDINLIISHHPIIFNEIKNINDGPLARKIKLLNKYDISAYSCHTNYDVNLEKGMGVNVINRLFEISEIKEHSLLDEYSIDGVDYGIGDIVTLKDSIKFDDVLTKVKNKLNINDDKMSVYRVKEDVSKIVVLPGSGSGDIDLVINEKPDVFITSDLKHNQILDLLECGISYINASHYGLEKIFVESFSSYLKTICNDKILTINNILM